MLVCQHCHRQMGVQEYEQCHCSGASDQSGQAHTRHSMKRSYTCNTCGGEISPGVLSASVQCPYCGRPIVFTDKILDYAQPDVIVPFQLEKNFFVERYRSLFAQRHFVPEDFTREISAEAIGAHYFPFWIYDIKASGSAQAQAEKIKKLDEHKFEHRVFKLSGSGEVEFRNIPQDGTKELDDELSQRLEPYDLGAGVAYSAAYFAGHDVRIGNRGSAVSLDDVRRRINASLDKFLIDRKDFDACRITQRSYTISPGAIRFAILPVYVMDLQWHGQTFKYAMNGQSGKLVGNFPIKRFNVAMAVLTLTALTVLGVWALGKVADHFDGFGQFMMLIPMIALVVAVGVVICKSKLPMMFENNFVATLLPPLAVAATTALIFLCSGGQDDTSSAVMILGFFALMMFFGFHSLLKSRLEDEARNYLTGLAQDADAYLQQDRCMLQMRESLEDGSYVSATRAMRR